MNRAAVWFRKPAVVCSALIACAVFLKRTKRQGAMSGFHEVMMAGGYLYCFGNDAILNWEMHLLQPV